MTRSIQYLSWLMIIGVFGLGCGYSKYRPYQYICGTSRINPSNVSPDTTVERMLTPYRVELSQKMNVPIAYLEIDYVKKKPESLLGNWMSDAMQWYADSILRIPVDFSTINYGGIRSPKLPKGSITIGMIYELMPFDNSLTIVTVDSSYVTKFFDHLAYQGGWPVSKEAKYAYDKHRKLTSWSIVSKSKDSFRIGLTDYIASGGDQMNIFEKVSKQYTNHKVRDILIAYAKYQQKLRANIEGRVTSISSEGSDE